MRTTAELIQALDALAVEFSAVDAATDTAVVLVVARQLAQNEWQATPIFAASCDQQLLEIMPDRLEFLNSELAAGGLPLGHVVMIRRWITAEDYRYRSAIQLLPEICEPDFNEAWAIEFLKKCCVEVRNKLLKLTGATVIDHQ